MGRSRRRSNIQGIVVEFDATRRCGSVRSDDAPADLAFHLDDLKDRGEVGLGSVLAGRIESTPTGPKLTKIRIIAVETTNPYAFYGFAALMITLLVGAVVYARFNVDPLLALLIGINVGALFFMGLDKSVARSNGIRTPEPIVYTLALLGGVPGVLLGIHVFKHKTRKAAFHFVLLLIVTAQMFLLQSLGIELRPHGY